MSRAGRWSPWRCSNPGSTEPRRLRALEKLTEEPGDDERRPVRAVPRVLHGNAESGRGFVQGQPLDDAEHECGPVQGIEPQEDRPDRFRKLVLVECRTGQPRPVASRGRKATVRIEPGQEDPERF